MLKKIMQKNVHTWSNKRIANKKGTSGLWMSHNSIFKPDPRNVMQVQDNSVKLVVQFDFSVNISCIY
jgi:hypothetical protein